MRALHYFVFFLVLMSVVFFSLAILFNLRFLWPFIIILPLGTLGLWDIFQTSHSVMRNYPIVAHMSWFFERFQPGFRHYFSTDTQDGPFNREQRSLADKRAEDISDVQPFGTTHNIDQNSSIWLNHSITPSRQPKKRFQITIGGAQCSHPYQSSILNISAMSFGALSGNAILALNQGANYGKFAHDTGEGGISRYHLVNGGDLIWELGAGYFGCCHYDRSFDPQLFSDQASDEQIKMVELKLSQGALPGYGAILPAAKVSREIAKARNVPSKTDCISPASHSTFSTPIEMMEFIAKLRELSQGKPIGFKLCVGHPWEFMAICKAMLETGIVPDFIVVDGAEGGSGAAPIESTNHIGMPLHLALDLVCNILVGVNLRDQIKIGASGKIISAFDIASAIAMGADWCNSARGFMFALGCIQAKTCHTNKCPVGIATQDRWRQRGLVAKEKAQRVYKFHRNTVQAFTQLLISAGLNDPGELQPEHLNIRETGGPRLTHHEMQVRLEPGELLIRGEPCTDPQLAKNWEAATSASFKPRPS